jgi:hypothetical protein
LAPAIQQGAQMINMMRQQQALDRQTAAQEQSMRLQMAGEGRAAADAARAAELQPFKVDEARNKSISDAIKVGMEFNKYINMSAADANSPEDFRAFAADIAANPLFQSDVFKNGLSQVVASIPNDPAQFAEWKRQTGLKTIEKDKLYKNELIKQETADGTRQLAVDPYGNRGASVVPGSEVSLGQKITYVKGPNGEVIPMPERTAAGGGLVGGARGGVFKSDAPRISRKNCFGFRRDKRPNRLIRSFHPHTFASCSRRRRPAFTLVCASCIASCSRCSSPNWASVSMASGRSGSGKSAETCRRKCRIWWTFQPRHPVPDGGGGAQGIRVTMRASWSLKGASPSALSGGYDRCRTDSNRYSARPQRR